jgi:two-component system chemotaxis response regulator CheY
MRVLIVDDSSFIREYLRQTLQRMGMVCEEAGNGQEALDAFGREAGFEEAGLEEAGFDLMLLDVNMPVMNGLECVRILRESRLGSGTRVMMVTTEADSSYIGRALEYGADEFLMKPFTAEALREKLMILGFEIAA